MLNNNWLRKWLSWNIIYVMDFCNSNNAKTSEVLPSECMSFALILHTTSNRTSSITKIWRARSSDPSPELIKKSFAEDQFDPKLVTFHYSQLDYSDLSKFLWGFVRYYRENDLFTKLQFYQRLDAWILFPLSLIDEWERESSFYVKIRISISTEGGKYSNHMFCSVVTTFIMAQVKSRWGIHDYSKKIHDAPNMIKIREIRSLFQMPFCLYKYCLCVYDILNVQYAQEVNLGQKVKLLPGKCLSSQSD